MTLKGIDTPGHVLWCALESGAIETQPVGGAAAVRESTDRELATVQKCAAQWGDLARKHSARTGVPVAWILGIMTAESAGNAAAVSSAGAIGLMQIMPFHAKGRNLRDPDTNIGVACDLLADMRKRGLDLVESASCYNAGPDAKTGGPKRGAIFQFGVKEEVPVRLRTSPVWGSYYIATICRAHNAALRLLGSAQSPADPSSGAALAAIVLAALVAGELL